MKIPAYQDKTIMFSFEHFQKDRSRPKLKFPQNLVLNEGCPLWMAATGTVFDKINKILCPSDREIPGDYFGHWNFGKRLYLARVTDNQSYCHNMVLFATFIHIPITFSGFHCIHFQCVLYLVGYYERPCRYFLFVYIDKWIALQNSPWASLLCPAPPCSTQDDN